MAANKAACTSPPLFPDFDRCPKEKYRNEIAREISWQVSSIYRHGQCRVNNGISLLLWLVREPSFEPFPWNFFHSVTGPGCFIAVDQGI
jgi:hypothetical protein